VISSREEVDDSVARWFAKWFYFLLGLGYSLRIAFESTRLALRISCNEVFREQADFFELHSPQSDADGDTLLSMCGTESCRLTLPGVNLEDAKACVDHGPGAPVEHFSGRERQMIELLKLYIHGPEDSGSPCRVVALYGPEGIGKSALGVTFASFASSPGRFFSCNYMRVVIADGVRFRSCVLDSIKDEVKTLALSGRPILLVLDDQVGAISGSPELQSKLGELLDSTPALRLLICSRAPICPSLGGSECCNYPLGGLGREEAAALLIAGVKRKIMRKDFPEDMPPRLPSTTQEWDDMSREDVQTLLQDNPLLDRLQGHPMRIRAVAGRVAPDGPSLLHLVAAT
jgi:hypothetical protein